MLRTFLLGCLEPRTLCGHTCATPCASSHGHCATILVHVEVPPATHHIKRQRSKKRIGEGLSQGFLLKPTTPIGPGFAKHKLIEVPPATYDIGGHRCKKVVKNVLSGGFLLRLNRSTRGACQTSYPTSHKIVSPTNLLPPKGKHTLPAHASP